MEIRALRENEIEQCIEHVCLVFRRPGSLRFRHHLTGDSSFELEQARVCVADGRIVSYVRVSDRPIRIGFAVVRMGGIGAVSTHPDYRARGYSTALLWDAVRYMERAGYDLSMLFTGVPRHYAKVGWATFPEHRFSVVAAEPPPLGTRYVVRDFDEARDLEAVIKIYDRYNEERTGTMARARHYWFDQHSRTMGVLPDWVVEENGEVVAYLRGTATNFGELAYLPAHREAVAPICARAMREANEAAQAATAAEDRLKSEPRISGELTRSHPALELLGQWSHRSLEHQETEGMMLRVIRLGPLMQKVAPVLEQRLAQSGLLPRRKTICIHEQGEAVRLVIDGHHLHAEAGEGGDIVLKPGSRNFLKLLFGDSTFTQLRELIPGAHAVMPDDAALLDRLFPKQEPVYYGCDHF
jgi:predicted N-acetyltransferase YhbS